MMSGCKTALVTMLAMALLAATATAQEFRVSIIPNSITVRPGAQFRTAAQPTGLTGGCRFEWFVANERTGGTNPVHTWIFRLPGEYVIRVVATELSGRTAEAQARVTVEAGKVEFKPVSSTSVAPGEKVHYEVYVSGLTPPYRCRLYLNGKPAGDRDISQSPEPLWAFNDDIGTTLLRLEVTDTNGIKVQGETTFTVGTGAPGPAREPEPATGPQTDPTAPPPTQEEDDFL